MRERLWPGKSPQGRPRIADTAGLPLLDTLLEQPPDPAAPDMKRPPLASLLAAAEAHFQIRQGELCQRSGSDRSLRFAHLVVVSLARACGYTTGQIAAVLDRPEQEVRALGRPRAMLTSSERAALEVVRTKLETED